MNEPRAHLSRYTRWLLSILRSSLNSYIYPLINCNNIKLWINALTIEELNDIKNYLLFPFLVIRSKKAKFNALKTKEKPNGIHGWTKKKSLL